MRRDEAASTSVEAVLLTPVLLFAVMLIVQFGLWFHAEHVVQAAAREGVRAARVESSTAEVGRDRALAVVAATGPGTVREPQVTARIDAGRATVAVSGRAAQVIPGFSLPVRAVATGDVERFTVDQP